MSFKFNEFCPLQSKKISEAECIEITSELFGMKTKEHILRLRESIDIDEEQMSEICSKCPNCEV